jgi:hypothetical protein
MTLGGVMGGDSFDYNFVGFGTYTLEKIEKDFVLFEEPLKIDIIVQSRGLTSYAGFNPVGRET